MAATSSPAGPSPLSAWPPTPLAPVAPVPALLGDFGNGPRAVLSLFTGPINLVKGNGVIDEGLAPNHGAGSGVSPASGAVSLNALGHGAIGDLGAGLGPGVFEGGITANALVDDVLVGQNFPFDHDLAGWNVLTGQMYPAFPQPMEDYQAFVEPAVAPVGGSVGSASVVSGSGLYLVHAYDIAGHDATDFPKFTGGWANQAPALADVDQSGRLSLLVGTHEGYLFSWSTPGDACANEQWWSNHHDEWNSGAYGAITRPPGAITDLHLGNVLRGPNGGFTAEWTASGAEFRCGPAASASVRISGQPITPQNFAQATEVATPQPRHPRPGSLDHGQRPEPADLRVRRAAGAQQRRPPVAARRGKGRPARLRPRPGWHTGGDAAEAAGGGGFVTLLAKSGDGWRHLAAQHLRRFRRPLDRARPGGRTAVAARPPPAAPRGG